MIKKLGQYFTTSCILQEKVFNLIKNKPDIILEPSCGRGDLVMYINKLDIVKFDCIEIDEKIDFLFTECTNVNLIIHDFLEYDFKDKKYKTIIGNPPYVKRKGKCNLYMSFIDKCIDLLEDEGELIFIIPSDFFETTSSKNINKKLIENGIITDIFKPESENLFIGASIDVLIFRYIKTFNISGININYIVNYNDELRTCINNNNLIQFVNQIDIIPTYTFSRIKDFFNIYVGMVSGKEKIFHNEEYGNIDVLTDTESVKKCIYIKNFPTSNNNLNNYMLENKDILMSRKIKQFTEKNWFEWGALRNIKIVENNIGKKCIYVKNITRSNIVAFISTVSYFSGSLLMLVPNEKVNINEEELHLYLLTIIEKINNNRHRYIFSNRFKITHKQLSNFIL
jgi:adenine-specific DNA-methyltransferase